MANSNIRVLNGVDNVTGLVSTRNWITNNNANTNTLGWATYADAAGPAPVNGTGGSPAVTWLRDNTLVYSGAASFLFTKDAVDRQGQGVSYDFEIDPTDRATVQQIKFDYVVGSGSTFNAGTPTTDSDITVWVYDTFNNVLIQPSTYKLFSNSVLNNGQFIANFQTTANSTSYRLILHCSTTSSAAYTLRFNNFQVARTQYALGTLITDWEDFTPTLGGFIAPAFTYLQKRRVGGSLQLRGSINTGTTSAAPGTILLPDGLKTASSVVDGQLAGGAQDNGVLNNTYVLQWVLSTGGDDKVYLARRYGPNSDNPLSTVANCNAIVDSNTHLAILGILDIPIAGWRSQQQTSDINDQRQITFSGKGGTQQLLTNYNYPIKFDIVETDTHAGYDPLTGVYTVPISGDYLVNFHGFDDNGGTSVFCAYKNQPANGTGVPDLSFGFSSGYNQVSGAGTVANLRAGDTIFFSATSGSQYVGAFRGASIAKILSPSQISTTETVAAKYTGNASFISTNTQPWNFGVKIFDTHGAVTTGSGWRFTAPIRGLYRVTLNGFSTTNTGEAWQAYINGVSAGTLIQKISGSLLCGSDVFYMNAGDYIDIRPSDAAASDFALTFPGLPILSIVKEGI